MHYATMGRSGLYFPFPNSFLDCLVLAVQAIAGMFKEGDAPDEPVKPGEVVTLDELKKRNAEQDEDEDDEDDDDDDPDDDEDDDDPDDDEDDDDPDDDDDDDEDDDEDPDPDEDEDEDEDPKGAKGKKGKKEDWMLDEDGNTPEPKTLTNSDAAKLRRKLQGKIDKERDEKEQLRERLKKLEDGGAPPPAKAVDISDLKEPKRSDFPTGEDGQTKYLEARQDYKLEIKAREDQSRQQAHQVQEQRKKLTQKVAEEVDSHYDRAAVLIQKSGIKPEQYQAADTVVREALEEKFPDSGDDVLDNLIAELGEGSERVIFNLGVNSKRLNEFLDSFDRRGFKALLYLERLNSKLKNPTKRDTSAPKPPPKSKGGDKGATAAQNRNLKKQYQEAHTKNNGQAAFEIKKKARAAGVDVSKW